MYLHNAPWYVELWSDWLEMLRDWPLGSIVAVIIGLVVLAAALAVLYGIFRLIDQAGTPKLVTPGRIVDKWIVEGHYVTEYTTGTAFADGKAVTVQVPYEKWVPPQPQVKVDLSGLGASGIFHVGSTEYDTAKKDTPVRVTYQQGRISGSVYPLSYEKA